MSTAEAVVLAAELAENVIERLPIGQQDEARQRLSAAIASEERLLRERAQAALDAR